MVRVWALEDSNSENLCSLTLGSTGCLPSVSLICASSETGKTYCMIRLRMPLSGTRSWIQVCTISPQSETKSIYVLVCTCSCLNVLTLDLKSWTIMYIRYHAELINLYMHTWSLCCRMMVLPWANVHWDPYLDSNNTRGKIPIYF